MTVVADSIVRARVNSEVKRQAGEILGGMGLTTSAAIRMFLARVVAEGSLPLEMKSPSKATREAFEASGRGRLLHSAPRTNSSPT